jgi:hypothetical protein
VPVKFARLAEVVVVTGNVEVGATIVVVVIVVCGLGALVVDGVLLDEFLTTRAVIPTAASATIAMIATTIHPFSRCDFSSASIDSPATASPHDQLER